MSISSLRWRGASALITARAAAAAVLALAVCAVTGSLPAPGADAVAGMVKTAATAAAGKPARTAALPGAATLPQLDDWQLAGQHIIYSYPGLTPPTGLLDRICKGQAAGVIFFGANISSEAQIAGVINQLNQADACPANPVPEPLILETDQEGGLVRRLPGGTDTVGEADRRVE